jgi:DNA-formamidopyrimidine glycosylase
MPEGIEIASIATDLNKKLCGKTMLNFEIDQYYLKRIGNEYKDFLNLLPLKIKKITFKGKVIIFDLGEACFTSQLGMSGRWGFNKNIPHTHFKVQFENHCSKKQTKGFWIYYSDIRRFGMVKFYCGQEGKKMLEQKLQKLAPDFLSKNPIAESEFIERFNRCYPDKFIGALLMDQEKICSGIGNYILSELFYRCKLYPFVKVYDLSQDEIIKIYQECKAIMIEGFQHKGNSLQDYYNIDGKKGSYQNCLQVYMKKKDPLGNHVLRQNGPHKRTIHWVPKIQKKKLRLRINGNFDDSDLEAGLSLLLQPFKNCIIQVINNPKIAYEYGFEETEDKREHLFLSSKGDDSIYKNYLVRAVYLDL